MSQNGYGRDDDDNDDRIGSGLCGKPRGHSNTTDRREVKVKTTINPSALRGEAARRLHKHAHATREARGEAGKPAATSAAKPAGKHRDASEQASGKPASK